MNILKHPRAAEFGLVALFVLAMAGANLAIAVLGPWFLPFTAFLSVGIVLVSRDYLHDVWRDRHGGGFWPRMVGMIVAAAVLAFAVDQSAARIAVASVCALVGTALVETSVFQAVFERRWMLRSNASNVAGALTDSAIFPLVAFGFGMGWLELGALVLSQTVAKVAGGVFWSVVAKLTLNPDRRRAARRAGQEVAA